MECNDILADGYGRVPESIEKVLNGLNHDDINWQPSKDANSIGWLIWHLTRQQDTQIAALMGEEQVWIRDKWYSQFQRTPDPKDNGFGHTPEQVSSFKSPDTRTLLDYHRAVLERSKKYFLTLSKADLDKELNDARFQPPPTIGVRLVSILGDGLQHAGQAAYVRGLRQGKGWQKY